MKGVSEGEEKESVCEWEADKKYRMLSLSVVCVVSGRVLEGLDVVIRCDVCSEKVNVCEWESDRKIGCSDSV